MNLLDKFDNIEITKENIVPETDMVFCKIHFDFYSKIYMYYESHLTAMQNLEDVQKQFQESLKEYEKYPDTYIYKYDGISVSETKKTMVSLSEHFINVICNYFENKYNITINKELVRKSSDKNGYEPRFCKLSEILDNCIVGDLNGMTFLEKAVEEIKGKAKTERYYSDWRKEWNYDIKGKTIKFRFGIGNILPALYFYDGLETEVGNCYTYNRVNDFRSFENGNTDIKFLKSEYAMEFARKYLGYTGE